MKFVCPKCAEPFEIREDGTAKCKNNHSFDKSREGYYNLLLSQSGKNHGDSREMLLARREFLNRGFYEPLALAIAEIFAERFSGVSADILDMGAGEGYYTERIASAGAFNISAFDISKDAVKLLAKRKFKGDFAVASSYKIPAPNESFDGVLNVFSPLAIEETARVLKKGALFVMVIPDSRHLYELKEAVYDSPYENEPSDEVISGFKLLKKEKLEYPMALSADEINALFMMTPYAHRTKKHELLRLDSLNALTTYARFIILAYEKL